MAIVGIAFNPMNVLAYRMNDLYLSLTLINGGLLMASNMIWTHEIIHYLSMNMFNKFNFIIGLIMSIAIILFLLRSQIFVDDKQWLRRMISHHSTALTTSHIIRNKTKDEKVKKLATDIIETQEREIEQMKSML
ncbi:DUF305 domain-containing protein [bacterium]|nr:DUF305 domain-containing protein [bacterium]